MSGLDWIVVGAYLAAMLGLAAVLARSQHDRRDYYLGGNRSGPLAIALSTMATQCSTNSILGAPAFVAFSVGGGLLWLQYELAVPLAMIVLMALLLPTFRSLRLISLYEFCERRFGITTRLVLSVIFQFVRAFATGVTVYGIGLVLTVCLDVDFTTAVLLLAVVTIAYDVLGGMRAVILSDVIQLAVLGCAIALAIALALDDLGGWRAMLDAVPAERLTALDLAHTGWGDGETYAFWPMLFGGLFLYVSYYGCDQSQAQRLLASRSVADTNTALFYNGLLRFPLVLAYCVLGLCIAALASVDPEFVSRLPTREDGNPEYNLAVVQFVFERFPAGLVGLVMVGLFAAAMSSLDSVLNALSATTMEDVVRRFARREFSARTEFALARALTFTWGVACVALAFVVGDIADSVLIAINKIGSLVNGPLLAVFGLGVLTRHVGERAVLSGLAAGIAADAACWLLREDISWLWWNVIGCVVTVVVALALSLPAGRRAGEETRAAPFSDAGLARRWWPSYAVLLLWAVVIAIVAHGFGTSANAAEAGVGRPGAAPLHTR